MTEATIAPAARRRPRITLGRVLLYVLLAVGALIMVFPFIWTIVTSITPGATLTTTPRLIPENPSLSPYLELFSRVPFGRVILNSLLIAVVSTLLQLVTSAMAAYVFARMPFRGRGAIFVLYLATMMIPFQVLIVPLFAEMKTLGLINTYLGAILPTIASAFGVFLLRQAMSTVPYDLDQAATLDGAGHFRIFFQIMLPLVRPALATLAVFAFLNTWNSFLWPLIILRDPLMQTLPVALSSLQGQYSTQWDVLMAGSVVSIIPMFALYVFAQKYIVQGVAGTGLK
ncbi:carbohydrate ABC transporter permease [Microbacterium sp.]|uniref:carbohydrate ABC transporter permease n=1 Tax=Microbacterium sp. TaxID=51671 RepID=UPI001AC9A284|nr:carbohydrate ABC transporter permease [Microbacterium sp.]MBN9183878.1 carbohydrate ABC transporter permease [Microbacterium sp.]MBN9190269.1 carbohydrate ABC transporter permease [Microbacterium sp.]MBN9193505.1 carbohydrate ABC transporter permease [Microbacterium sp.]